MPPKEFAPSQCGKSVTLTEIHSDPKRVKDRFGEFIEVYNDSNSRVDLTGWRLSDGELIRDLGKMNKGQSESLHAISIAPNGKLMAVADGGGQVVVYSLES